MSKNTITTEEKIDYIYNRLKRQEKIETIGFVLKWATRIFIVWSLLYFFLVKLPVLKDEIIESITPEVPTFDMDSITNSDTLESIKEKFSNISSNQLEKLWLSWEPDDQNNQATEPNYY